MASRSGFAVAVLSALGLLLTGCAPADLAPSSLVGLTLDVAKDRIPQPTTLVTYDVSETVAHREPSYTGGGEDAAWMVLAACTVGGGPLRADGPNLALAIAPAAAVSETMRSEARRAEFTTLLAECSSR